MGRHHPPKPPAPFPIHALRAAGVAVILAFALTLWPPTVAVSGTASPMAGDPPVPAIPRAATAAMTRKAATAGRGPEKDASAAPTTTAEARKTPSARSRTLRPTDPPVSVEGRSASTTATRTSTSTPSTAQRAATTTPTATPTPTSSSRPAPTTTTATTTTRPRAATTTPAPTRTIAPTTTTRPPPTTTKPPPALTALGDRIAARARAIAEGPRIRYVWGGKTPAGYDCSGFVWQVLRDAGLNVPYRDSGALKAWAAPVSRAQARPGDLVFWPGHVSIYLGDGMIADASASKSDVVVRAAWSGSSFGRVRA